MSNLGKLPSRRAVLGTAGAAGVLASTSAARPFGMQRKTTRVVVVAFSGGVRSRETFASPDNVPNLRSLADDGVLYPRLRTANLGHFGATSSIFTGVAEQRGIRENTRGPDPTLFEYLRKDLGLSREDVWITTSGGAQQANFAYGLHPDYGPRYGANTLDGDGIFNRQFRDLIERYGRPSALPAEEQALLDQLRKHLGRGADGGRAAEAQARVEEYILNELTRGTADISGAAAGDRKALRLARNLLSLFKPKVLGVVLQNADLAHGSFNSYVEVIRRNDAAIGELRAAIEADPELRESTALFVLPEFGRDRDLNSRRGLDHGDGSDDLRLVSGVAWGPDFRRGKTIDHEQRVIDVTATVVELLGGRAKHSKGRTLRGLYA